MVTRLLPPAEWPKLDATDAANVWRGLDPATTDVIVVERDGVIVGHHILFPVLHAECLWIRDEDRGKGSVARRLWREVQRVAVARGVRSVMTAATDDRVKGLLAHVGATALEGEHYLVPLRG